MKKIKYPFRIVLIADRVSEFKNITLKSDNLEYTEDQYFEQVSSILKNIVKDVVFYKNPREFIDNINKHKNDMVLPMWSGNKSRNRRALIPSICESYKIKFIGADTYANIICQDKTMSKEFCKKQHISTSNYVIYNEFFKKEFIEKLSLPVVVKPNFEGGSIGISKFNLIHNYKDAISLAGELYAIYKQDILIEEFISGREISLVICGNKNTIHLAEAIEIVFDDKLGGLSNKLYSYEIKKANEDEIYNKNVTNEFPKKIIDNALKVFRLLGKVENIRIDGKYDDEKKEFKLIELTPDIHYGIGSTFSYAFESINYTYEGMWDIILKNTIDSFNQSS